MAEQCLRRSPGSSPMRPPGSSAGRPSMSSPPTSTSAVMRCSLIRWIKSTVCGCCWERSRLRRRTRAGRCDQSRCIPGGPNTVVCAGRSTAMSRTSSSSGTTSVSPRRSMLRPADWCSGFNQTRSRCVGSKAGSSTERRSWSATIPTEWSPGRQTSRMRGWPPTWS